MYQCLGKGSASLSQIYWCLPLQHQRKIKSTSDSLLLIKSRSFAKYAYPSHNLKNVSRNSFKTGKTTTTTLSESEKILTEKISKKEVPLAVLKSGNAVFVQNGNKLIFNHSVLRISGPDPGFGDPLVVSAFTGEIIGWGVYNPRSIYRIRMMQLIEECESDIESMMNISLWVRKRLSQAEQLRKALNLPSDETNVYRLVNSDGDGMSGMIVDVLGNNTATVFSGAAWLEVNRQEIVSILQEMYSFSTIIWRLSPTVHDSEGVPNAKEAIYSIAESPQITFDDTLTVRENNAKFNVNVSGQKTGFYADQRDSRFFLRTISKGKRVLDLCCYSGGFSINAAIGGAAEVLGIDSSQAAINCARQNAKDNGVEDICHFEKNDILNVLQVLSGNGEKWDIVILDPPKLAFTKAGLNKSLVRYRKLNRMAMGAVKEGGILMTCSCSGAMTPEKFMATVKEASEQCKRQLSVLRIAGAGADHCFDSNHPEGNYLKNFTFCVK